MWDCECDQPWWGDGDYIASMYPTESAVWEAMVDCVKTGLEFWLDGDKQEEPEFEIQAMPVEITVHDNDIVCSKRVSGLPVPGSWKRAVELASPSPPKSRT